MEPQATLIIGDMQVQLWAARTLADYYRPGGDQEARRRGWLKALLGIVEPWMGEGRPVPVGEIVVDLRWGIRADAGGPGGFHPSELAGRPGHTDTRLLADIEFWDTVEGLTNLPEEEISPLISAATAALILTRGPIEFVLPDTNNPADVLRIQKILLHTPSHNGWALDAITGRRRKTGGWNPMEERYRIDRSMARWYWFQDHPEAPGGLGPPLDWRDYTAELAEAGGLPHPNQLSSLQDWLHPSLRQRPGWLRDA